MDDRATTPAVTHALTIGITAILVTGLLIGAGQLSADQRSYVVEQGLENVGGAVTSELTRLDQFRTNGVDADVSVTTSHPPRVGGETYTIDLSWSGSVATVRLSATDHSNLPVVYRFRNETAVCESAVNGGDIVVAYDATNSCLELRNR